jgi:uncharacterized protein YifE (UPF0438 family)
MEMPIPIYLKHKRIFDKYFVKRFRNAEDDLTSRERKSLEKHGTRLEALKNGTLHPQTEDERHFLAVCCGAAKSVKIYERAWLKYQYLLKEERELENLRLEQFKNSPEYNERIQSMFRGDVNHISEEVRANSSSEQSNLDEDHKKCPSCRGAGMKGDGFNCDRCNGRGYIKNEGAGCSQTAQR